MDFPAYVPPAVRVQISAMIEGDAREPHGRAESLAGAEQRLAEIEGAIATKIQCHEVGDLDSLRKQKVDAIKSLDLLEGYVGCLRRLALDSRMRKAFDLLTREFTADQQWRGFIHAAWAAQGDYTKYRERIKLATKLKGEISDAANTLAKLIRQFANTGINGPGEFYSIPTLLRKTDNHAMRGHNLQMWRAMRIHVLGDPPRHIHEIEQAQENGEESTSFEFVIKVVRSGEKPEIDQTEQTRNSLSYAWRTAPDLPALLDTVSKAARYFRPGESEMIEAAISSRQRSIKTEYLRAFAHQLTDHSLILTTVVMQAMAIVANVVINLPDVDVSYDDVRHALSRPGS